ncbi:MULTISPECIES: hypothetical protein [Bacillus]|uniref:hypothetical protein n=1 Tax=Bacillus TaxID=1386 RepID=UPI000279D45D|nr:hypothetical protein [Bacillus cereus]EJR70988.1 hypothetical protein IK7_06355 [Bacillus cereus VD156]KGT40389.1 hypothetical protein IY08_30405 [Bacillus cereus]KXZ05816.1 hypothetical protein AT281_06555 [Bacillus cereus]MBJ8154435.1 hypothetical protein [Bacillus cereus]PET55150.1 hypothetical protein CN536_28930 [Bacillus cereus]
MEIIKNNKHYIALFISIYSIGLSIYFGIPVFNVIFNLSNEKLNYANLSLTLYFVIMIFVFFKLYRKYK